MARPKHRYGNPRVGTKRARLVAALMRGGTHEELARRSDMSVINVKNTMARFLRDDYGYDIRFRVIDRNHAGRPTCSHMIVGRYRWDGSYRSFLTRRRIERMEIDVGFKEVGTLR